MSKKRDLETIEDMDESTYELLGSKLSKLASANRSKDRFRERRANDFESLGAVHRTKRIRDRPEYQDDP